MSLKFKSDINWVFASPSKPWVKFFARFPEIINLPLPDWKEIHCLSYFVCKYQEHYGRQYSFSFQGPPLGCQELVLTKKIIAALGGLNADIFTRYIDWIFETKVKNRSAQIKSISFLLSKGLTNEFIANLQRLSKIKTISKISRATKLPDNYLDLASKYGLELLTYGDIAFLQKFSQHNPQDCYNSFFQELQSLGFNLDLLSSVV
ncbi:MAG: hypothetical protein ABWZ79_04005 [Pedobacter agri]